MASPTTPKSPKEGPKIDCAAELAAVEGASTATIRRKFTINFVPRYNMECTNRDALAFAVDVPQDHVVLFHGMTPQKARSIFENGFSSEKSKSFPPSTNGGTYDGKNVHNFYDNKSASKAFDFGQYQVPNEAQEGVFTVCVCSAPLSVCMEGKTQTGVIVVSYGDENEILRMN